MAMNVRNRDAFYQSADFCSTYNLQPITYGNSSHYFPRIPGPESALKPPVNLLCQPQPPAFQPASPSQPLGLPPAIMSPDPLAFPLCGPLAAKPLPPHLQLVPSAPIAVALAPSPKPPEEECPMAAPDQDPTLEELCKPLYCKLCSVTLNSAQQAHAHYRGKNHSKKLRNFYAGSQQPPPIRIPEEVEAAGQQPLPPPSENASAGTKQPPPKGPGRVILATENDYCKLCDASFSSAAVAHAHYQGKNHAKRLRLTEAQQSSSSADTADLMHRRSRKDGMEFRFNKNRRVHLNPAMTGPYYTSRPRLRIPRDLAMCVTPSGQFYCSMCNSGACEEADFRLHLESKQHKSKVSEQRYRSEMESLGYT